jgi:NAD(P)-dependent dehydrogenase (short-subunit alcohol dehydrogenase family)
MVDAAVAELGSLDMLVVDGAALFTHGAADGKVVGAAVGATDGKVVEAAGGAADGGGAHRALRTCLDTTWNITRAVVNHAFLPADPGPSPRRIVYLAPAAGAGESAGAALAGLENLSRTLSTEWARYGITVVTIAPGEMTAAGEVAALCAYLASPAGAYFSGCLLDLRGV